MRTLLNLVLDRLSVRAWRRMLTWGVTLLAAAGAISVERQIILLSRKPAEFQCEQADEWRFVPGGEVRVVSRLTLRQAPAGKPWMPVAFPFDNVTLEGAAFNGEPVPCVLAPETESPAGWYVLLNRPPKALREGLIEVQWRFPASNLEPEGDILRMPLETLVPAWSYTVALTAEPGSGHRLASQPGLDWNVPFTTSRGSRNPPAGRIIGSCGILATREGMAESTG